MVVAITIRKHLKYNTDYLNKREQKLKLVADMQTNNVVTEVGVDDKFLNLTHISPVVYRLIIAGFNTISSESYNVHEGVHTGCLAYRARQR
jgi:hypothetical protein